MNRQLTDKTNNACVCVCTATAADLDSVYFNKQTIWERNGNLVKLHNIFSCLPLVGSSHADDFSLICPSFETFFVPPPKANELKGISLLTEFKSFCSHASISVKLYLGTDK